MASEAPSENEYVRFCEEAMQERAAGRSKVYSREEYIAEHLGVESAP